MIIYNVTIKVSKDCAESWKEWMVQEHIPDMMATGLFIKNNFSYLLDEDETEGLTYVTQYFCKDRAAHDEYLEKHATSMKQKGINRFDKEKVIAFRTLMKTIDTPQT